ncbi:SAC3 family protein C-like isoform X1 [Salvia splendens]|uniref:SAC3 family protein C-like isoform X1 n=1 Tax=Salvia splendens TaxID=180675 RepID=UPI001C25D265|nr:SAC3 family protein C-like isoform X1 [Salvia splendens]
MANRSRQPCQPRINNSSSSYLSHSDSTHSKIPKPSNRIYSTKTSSSSSKTGEFSRRIENSYYDDGDQDPPNLIGTCPFMCPLEERQRRERLRDLAVFERLHGNPAKTSPALAVKKFCRTISSKDMKASDVRPVPVLEDTLNYLLDLLHSSGHPFDVVHDFIFDRTRSIRQDLSMQNIVSDQVIHMYERMVKFHIISYHHLHRSSQTPNTASMSHLNLEQLMKALTTLFSLYEVNRASHSASQNEAEYFSLYLLLHLSPDNQVEPLSLWFRRIPSSVMESKAMSFARRILSACRYYRLGNYKRFISTTEEEASYLQYCIVEPYISEVRKLALSCISYGGYKLQPYPVEHLSKILLMKESDVEALSIDCDLETSDVGTGKGLVSSKQAVINKTSKEYKYYELDSSRIERLCAELPPL